jgi:prepilin-type N-terminal cleavage/methylation domain
MKKIKAFTLIEVMISIFVFSSAMVGFMAFHAHTMSVLFENESAQLAHALAFNLVDEINAMSYDSFSQFISKTNWTDDADLQSLFGSDFKASPFNSYGEQKNEGNYRFYRALKVDTYANQTQLYVQQGSYLSTLYHVEVRVAWPKRNSTPTHACNVGGYSSEVCNSIIIPLVRSAENY